MSNIGENDLKSTLFVSPLNKMSGRFKVVANGDSYLTGFYITRAFKTSDLDSKVAIRVQRNNDVNSTIDIKYRGNSDLVATLQPKASEFLEATLDVRPNNVMFGIFNVIEPPRLTEVKKPLQDSTVRSLEEFRYINFGSNQTLVAGTNGNEILSSYIKFDLSNHPSTTVFEKSVLRIHYPSIIDENSLELWKIDREWKEDGITYANKPLSTQLITDTYTINTSQKYIEIDLLSYIQETVSNDFVDNFGFELRGLNTTGEGYTFFSKESSKSPELTSVYFDSRVWNVSDFDLQSTIFVYGKGDSDLNATLDVNTDRGEYDLDATLWVHRYDTPEHIDKTAVLGVSNPDLNAKLTVAQRDISELNARLTARRTRMLDMEASLGVSHPELIGELFISYTSDLDSTLIGRQSKNSEIESVLAVSNPSLDTTLYVKYSDDLDAILTINVNKEYEIDTLLTISNPTLDATLLPRPLDNSYLNATIVIVGLEDVDVDASLGVSNPVLDATIYVRYRDDLDANLTVRRSDTSELSAYLSVSVPDLNAVLYPRVVKDEEAILGISVPELSSMIIIRAFETNDFEAFLHPRIMGVSDITATIGFTNKARSGSYYYII